MNIIFITWNVTLTYHLLFHLFISVFYLLCQLLSKKTYNEQRNCCFYSLWFKSNLTWQFFITKYTSYFKMLLLFKYKISFLLYKKTKETKENKKRIVMQYGNKIFNSYFIMGKICPILSCWNNSLLPDKK